MCPEIFSLSDDGYAVADPEDVPPELQDSAREAVANCPERAIIETND
jgi:ferredoxin